MLALAKAGNGPSVVDPRVAALAAELGDAVLASNRMSARSWRITSGLWLLAV